MIDPIMYIYLKVKFVSVHINHGKATIALEELGHFQESQRSLGEQSNTAGIGRSHQNIFVFGKVAYVG